MGPRIQVEPNEFLAIVKKENGLVIQKKKQALTPVTYLTNSGEYYYYTYTNKLLPIPEECELKVVKNILL